MSSVRCLYYLIPGVDGVAISLFIANKDKKEEGKEPIEEKVPLISRKERSLVEEDFASFNICNLA